MTDLQALLSMAFDAAVALAGLVLLFRRDEGVAGNKFKAFGLEFEITTPALVVFLAGCGLFVLPHFLPPKPTTPNAPPRVSETATAKGPPATASPQRRDGTATDQAEGHTTDWAGVFATVDRFSLSNDVLTLEMRYTSRATEELLALVNPQEFRLVDESSGQSWKPELTSEPVIRMVSPKQSFKVWAKFRFDQPPPETLTLIGGGLDSSWEMLRPN